MTDARRLLPKLVPRPEDRYAPFPLTDVQEAYWLGRSGFFDLGTAGTNIFMEFELVGGDAAVDDVERAVRVLVERHAMLRARILPDGRQRILAQVPPFRVERRTLRGRPAESQRGELDELRRRLRFAKGPLAEGPLFDVVACLEDGERVRLLMRIDALIMDGKSRMAFVKELFAVASDASRRLPPLECTYRDYAVACAELEGGESRRAAREYWMSRAAGLPGGPVLPLAREMGPETLAPLETLSLTLLPADGWARVKRRAVSSGVTPSAVVIAAFVEVVRRVSATPCFTLSLIGTWRPAVHPQIDDVLGNFNTISLLSVDGPAATFRDGVTRLQRQIMVDLNHTGYSGILALRELNRLHRTGARTATPVMFNSLLHHIAPGPRPTPSAASAVAPARRRRRFVTASMSIPQAVLIPTVGERRDGALECGWQSASSLFPPGEMETLAAAYRTYLERLAADEESWASPRALVTVPAPAATGATRPAREGAPRTPEPATDPETAARLRALWADVLGHPPGPGRDFYDEGGDSLGMVRLLLRVEESFGRALPRDILSGPLTIASLGEALARSAAAVPEAPRGEEVAS